METHIKRGIKFILYIVAATIGFTLIMLGFQHKTGKSAADSSSFFAPQVFADAPGDNSGGDDDDATGSTNGNDGNDDNSADSSSDSGGGND